MNGGVLVTLLGRLKTVAAVLESTTLVGIMTPASQQSSYVSCALGASAE